MKKLLLLFLITLLTSTISAQETPTPDSCHSLIESTTSCEPIHADSDAERSETHSEKELQYQEFLTVLHELLQSNEGCQLPCFWGFIPGITRVEDVVDFWTTTFETPIETVTSEEGHTFATFWKDFVPQNSLTDFFITMTFKNDVLWLLKVSTSNTAIWMHEDWLSLQSVLEKLSNNSFYLRVTEGQVVLILLNPQANLLIQKSYQLRVRGNTISPDSAEPLLLCPTAVNLIDSSLWLLDDETPMSIEETLGNKIVPGSELAPYQPIEFMTNLNSEEFSTFIQQNPNDCVKMLPYSELFELGYSF